MLIKSRDEHLQDQAHDNLAEDISNLILIDSFIIVKGTEKFMDINYNFHVCFESVICSSLKSFLCFKTLHAEKNRAEKVILEKGRILELAQR